MSRRSAIFFAAPTVLILALFFIYPLLRSMYMSLTDYSGVGEATFAGLDNYIRIFTRDEYIRALGITVAFTIMVVVFQTLAGLLFAAALFRLPRVRNFTGRRSSCRRCCLLSSSDTCGRSSTVRTAAASMRFCEV